MAVVNPKLVSIGVFAGMAAVGSTIVPAMTKKATNKAANQKLTKATANIDFENMGPEIVRKDKSSEEEE